MLRALAKKYFHLPLWLWILLIVAGVAGFAIYKNNQPRHAGFRFGACRVFLEHTMRFPDTINVIVGGETQSSATIAYSGINAYGSQQVKVFECHYSQNARGQMILSRITVDRRPLSDALVAKFNAMLPLLAGQELNTELPKDFPRRFEDFRK